MKLLSFEEALGQSKNQDRSILLGNGFSIAWNKEIFSYASLKQKIKGIDKDVLKVFSALNTADFEEVIRAFHHAGIVCDSLGIKNDFRQTSEKIRDLLIATIADSHPDYPDKISTDEFNFCVNFLSNFGTKIYTLNYDMLLYWILIRDMFREDGSKPLIRKLNDGFAYNDEQFLNWDGASFDIHYLHGALHLFEQEALIKLNYTKTRASLKQQFIKLIKDQERMPLFVAEGTSKQKLTRIHSSGYLTRCLNSLQNSGAKTKPSALFTYGVSLAANDEHIVRSLGKNHFQNFFIGIYGDPNSQTNKMTIASAERIGSLRSARKSKSPANIFYYDASTAKVWR